jgi:hypothetical protein
MAGPHSGFRRKGRKKADLKNKSDLLFSALPLGSGPSDKGEDGSRRFTGLGSPSAVALSWAAAFSTLAQIRHRALHRDSPFANRSR